jgi:thiamine phosphate synthase YjbQ (UPF0047 family)
MAMLLPAFSEDAHTTWRKAASDAGCSECIPVVDGELALGTWQSIMLFDLDGRRARKVTLQIVGAE